VQGGERARDEMMSVLQVAASASLIDLENAEGKTHDRYGKRRETDGGSAQEEFQNMLTKRLVLGLQFVSYEVTGNDFGSHSGRMT
jgi:hypothetical protein